MTGATGFVGSWLVKALVRRKAQVVALVRDLDHQSELVRSGAIRRVTVVNGCLEDFAALERAINEHEVDTVFHLAAQAIVGAALRNPLPTFEANIRGTYNLLEACRIHAGLVKAVVVASSDKAYGDHEDLPYTEQHALIGRHPYDVSKSCTDLIATTYHHTYGMPVTIARCGNIYGGGDLNWSRIVPGTIRSLLDRQRPVLRSDGTMIRDYFYVEDAVSAYLALAERIERSRCRRRSLQLQHRAARDRQRDRGHDPGRDEDPRPSPRDSRTRLRRRSKPRRSAPERPDPSSAGRPSTTWQQGSERRSTGIALTSRTRLYEPDRRLP